MPKTQRPSLDEAAAAPARHRARNHRADRQDSSSSAPTAETKQGRRVARRERKPRPALRFETVIKFDYYDLVKHCTTKIYYIGWYDLDARQMRRRSLKTSDGKAAWATVERIDKSGVTGDPVAFLSPRIDIARVLKKYQEAHAEANVRLQVFSDLHVDVRSPKSIQVVPGVDAVVVAGDVCEGAEHAFAHLREIVPLQIPILATLGNHEYYRRCWREEVAHARGVAPLYGIHLLENDEVVIGNVRFVGATLWTDYALFGEAYVPLAMHAASKGLNDHRRITWTKEPWARFRPQEALDLHRRSRGYIETALAKPYTGGATVVVTHHTPHPRSVHPRYGDDLLSAAFVSDLAAVIEAGQPQLWIHGHVHSSFDYHVRHTRVLANPHGYGGENSTFDPALLVEVA